MTVEVIFVGLEHRTNRIWGYLKDSSMNNIFSKYCYFTFWGIRNGNLYFKNVFNNVEFQKHKKKKLRRYVSLLGNNEHIIEQYQEHKIIKKLKNEPIYFLLS